MFPTSRIHSSRWWCRGAETVARRAGYRLLLCNSENDLAFEREYVEEMISHRVEGLLIAPCR